MKFSYLSILILFSNVGIAQVMPESIEIIRDKWGVPHIYAPTDAGVAYGLAWAHAEDDFATIQLTMLSGKQMLGRHLGKDGAAVDYVVGLLRAADLVSRSYQTLSPAYQAVIEAYVAGINSYAAHHPKEVLVKKSFPVTVEEVLRAYVLSLAVISGADKTIASLVSGKTAVYEEEVKGSNALAVSRKKSSEGYTMLAVNSHQPLTGPVSWYEAHLVSDEGWNAMGGLFPGGATIFHGTNKYLGWAHTVNYQDKIDVFELEMHPDRENTYRIDDEWIALEVEKIKLKVKLFAGLKINVKKEAYWSKYGPVVKNDKGYFAFNLGALHDLRAPEQWYRMNKSVDLQSFKEALKMTAIPGFSIIYADKYDSLYFLDNGKIPLRNPDFNWEKTIAGNTSKTLIQDFHPLEDLPQLANPAGGYIFNTNHSPFLCCDEKDNLNPNDYDPTMGYKVWNNNRSTRVRHLLQAHDSLSYEDFLTIKYDLSLPDSLAYFMDVNELFSLNPTPMGEASKEVLQIIQQWNKRAGKEDIGAAQFLILMNFLKEQIKTESGEYIRVTENQLIRALDQTANYLIKHFGKYAIDLGNYQILKRGDIEMPIQGMPDVIAAIHSQQRKEGQAVAHAGESYIMMVRYPAEGLPVIETINVYGASNKESSPHYADQMEMFVNQKRKPMTLDLDEVRKNAKKIYRPK